MQRRNSRVPRSRVHIDYNAAAHLTFDNLRREREQIGKFGAHNRALKFFAIQIARETLPRFDAARRRTIDRLDAGKRDAAVEAISPSSRALSTQTVLPLPVGPVMRIMPCGASIARARR